jgi:signal transduction histidine kinase/ActR/RegA family two-component response regulator
MTSAGQTVAPIVPALESVLCTEELNRRPSRPPDYERENRALVALAQALADSPRTILQTLADTILKIFECDSGGVSLVTKDGKRFYWPAIAGVWKPYIGEGTPRDFGPCGDVLDRDCPLLFSHFERRYTYFEPVMPPAEECLLVPFYVEGKAVGTIWAISHDDRPGARRFDREDLRVLVSLGTFASAAYQAVEQLDTLRKQAHERHEAQQALREMNEALLVSSVRQHELAEQARQAEDALREGDRRKDEFLAMLAHELRNPLAPIRTAAQVLRLKGPAEPELELAQNVIDRQVQQLTRLVDDLLDLSRVSRGKIDLQLEPVALADVVARAVEISRPLIDARKHHLEVSLPEEAVQVEGDPARLAQVVSNLLNNAAKYTEEGGRVWLTVELANELPQRPREVLLRVRDTGVGVAADMLPNIFQMFTQVRGSVSRSEGGLGIGLSLVRSLVELHHGSVTALSDGLGRGSEFIVRLPLLEAPAPIPDAGKQPTRIRKASPRRILVVDDNRDAADTLALLLRMNGHEVHTAYDGPTALDVARAQPPDVVLLDIGLPGASGLEVARRMRQDLGLNDALLVALTGYGQDEDRRRSEEAGFNAHLVKPVDLDALHDLLARAPLQVADSPDPRPPAAS